MNNESHPLRIEQWTYSLALVCDNESCQWHHKFGAQTVSVDAITNASLMHDEYARELAAIDAMLKDNE